mmetsp:Transcript_27610/g.47941  ORF Transcript_27610/g.47941 Transcript_27610/m.47941 type:complete len:150 (+) Transcript_27610:1436-1885(+)
METLQHGVLVNDFLLFLFLREDPASSHECCAFYTHRTSLVSDLCFYLGVASRFSFEQASSSVVALLSCSAAQMARHSDDAQIRSSPLCSPPIFIIRDSTIAFLQWWDVVFPRLLFALRFCTERVLVNLLSDFTQRATATLLPVRLPQLC